MKKKNTPTLSVFQLLDAATRGKKSLVFLLHVLLGCFFDDIADLAQIYTGDVTKFKQSLSCPNHFVKWLICPNYSLKVVTVLVT